MIGNDVVDLRQASIDSPKNFKGLRWKRFLDKVFTEEEQEFIVNSKNQFKTVWMLWSMKEAAYKIHVRQYEKRTFNPKKFKCQVFYRIRGKVSVDNHDYYTTSQINEDYIYTVASSEKNIKPISSCLRLENSAYENQYKVARNEVLLRFSELKNTPISSIEIIKGKAGVPWLFINGKKQEDSLSITHHGAYCGFALN